MKNLKNLGKKLTKNEQKSVIGGGKGSQIRDCGPISITSCGENGVLDLVTCLCS